MLLPVVHLVPVHPTLQAHRPGATHLPLPHPPLQTAEIQVDFTKFYLISYINLTRTCLVISRVSSAACRYIPCCLVQYTNILCPVASPMCMFHGYKRFSITGCKGFFNLM